MLVALVLWGRQLCPAAEPLSLAEAMQERSALGKALTNQFARPGEEASAEGSPHRPQPGGGVAGRPPCSQLSDSLPGSAGGSVPGFRAPARPRRSRAEPAGRAVGHSVFRGAQRRSGWAGGRPGHPGSGALERAEPTPRPTTCGSFMTRPPGASPSSGRSSPKSAARPTRPPGRPNCLSLSKRASALRESAGLPEVLPIWQVALALEGLLKRLATKPANLSPSVVRTMAGALDLLERPVPPARAA